MYRTLVVLFISTALLVCSQAAAAAQGFFQGKTIRLVVGSAPGASYDTYSRLLVPYLRAQIPGSPDIVVQNMPAAGGTAAANYVYNVADRDGLTIGMFNRAAVLSAVVGNPLSKFKPVDIFWLGTAASFADNAYLFVIKGLPYTTIDQMRNAPRLISVGNSGSAPVLILKDVLGLNVKVIEGYSKSELDLAFERGEVDGEGIAYSNLRARHPEWLSKKLVRPMIQFARRQRHSDFQDVPTARELARTDEERAIIDLVDAPFLIAYPYGLPPDVPTDRADVLRKAFAAALEDPAYAQQARAQKLDYSPKAGAEVQSIISEISASSPAVIARYRQIVGENAGN
jgi:tripartite-type tricarboxylate transporter receptor subunit TctC